MDILQVIESTGNCYRKKSSTSGGEFSGPCPWCGGNDRFSIQPAKNHFVCRKCKRAGDGIEFVRSYFNKNYYEACVHLGINPSREIKPEGRAYSKPGVSVLTWQPREIEFPPEAWRQKAEAVLFEKFKFLMSAAGTKYRTWLNDRGISNKTIKLARIGYNTSTTSFDREAWGLTPELKENGTKRVVYIPTGYIIPQFYNQKLVRLRIRQENPISKDRFIMVSGSAMGYFDYQSHLNDTLFELSVKKKPACVIEAELDGWLIQQEAGDLVQVYAIGNVSTRPDIFSHKTLSVNPGLLNLDNDEAGRNEQAWWKNQYPNCLTWYSLEKDAGEDFQAGVNIRQWILDGLKKINQEPDPFEIMCKGLTDIDLPQKKEKPEGHERAQLKFEKAQAGKGIKTKKKVIPHKYPDRICRHNLFCHFLKDGVCLKNKMPIFAGDGMDRCPIDQWWIYKAKNSVISEIILGPGVKKP